VHFSEDVAETHNDEIALDYVSQDRVDIHLGFLKLNHRYHITFMVKDNLGDKIAADKNENIAIHESVPNEEGIINANGCGKVIFFVLQAYEKSFLLTSSETLKLFHSLF